MADASFDLPQPLLSGTLLRRYKRFLADVRLADCAAFRTADDIDPAYGTALRHAVAAGVEALAFQVRFKPPRVEPVGLLPVDQPPPRS